MISVPRGVLRRCRTLLRKLIRAAPRGPEPLVFVRRDAESLVVEASRGGVGLRWRSPDGGAPAAFRFGASRLVEFEGPGDDPVTFEPSGPKRAVVRWQDRGVPRSCELDLIDAAMPTMANPPAGLAMVPAGFLTALGEATKTAATLATRYALDRVLVRGKSGEIVATDARQLLIQGGFRLPWTDDALIPAVPAFAERWLAEAGPVRVARDAGGVFIAVGPWEFSLPHDPKAKYPPYADIVPRSGSRAARCTLDPADVDEWRAVVPRLPRRSEEGSPVTLDVGERVVVCSRDAGSSDTAESVAARTTATGPPGRAACDRTHLMRALALGLTTLEVHGPDRPLCARCPDVTYVFLALGADAIVVPDDDASAKVSDTPSPLSEPSRNGRPGRNPQPVKDDPMPLPRRTDPDPPPESPDDPLTVAEAALTAVRDATTKLGLLTAALRRHRRQSQAFDRAVRSLRQFRALDG